MPGSQTDGDYPRPMSDGEIYSLASFGWDKEAREDFLQEQRKKFALMDDDLLELTKEMEMRDNIRLDEFRTAFVCEHEWPGRGCPRCQLDIESARQLRKVIPWEAKLKAAALATSYARETGKIYSIDDIDYDPAFAALCEVVWSRDEQDKLLDALDDTVGEIL